MIRGYPFIIKQKKKKSKIKFQSYRSLKRVIEGSSGGFIKILLTSVGPEIVFVINRKKLLHVCLFLIDEG